MRKLFVVFAVAFAAISCVAQTQYVKITKNNGVLTFTNVSGQAIVGIVGSVNLNGRPTGTNTSFGTNNFMQDNFFDAEGFAAGASFDFDTKNQPTDTPRNYSVTLSYIQFADGSSWGDRTTAENMFSHRAMALSVLQNLNNASADNAQFLAALNTKQTDPDMDKAYSRYRWLQQNVGTAEAVAQVKTRYAAAQSRINSGKF